MAMQYINYIRSKTHLGGAPTQTETPVLNEEDEEFLNRITSEENPPALPPRPEQLDVEHGGVPPVRDAQTALLDGAQNIPLPETPQSELTERRSMFADTAAALDPRTTWSWLRRDSRNWKRETTASDLSDIAQGLKDADAQPNEDNLVEDAEAKKEEEDMAIVLDKLDLAAVNNRAFSVSAETQELLQRFNQVLKDLMKGVPTAYDDLEKLLTTGDDQLQKTFNSLPSFLQKLIAKLPGSMAPGLAAAAHERAEQSGINMENAGKAAAAAKKMGIKTPSLADLTGKPAAIASLLRSIIMYLRARFPAFMGMNVLWSLAMFVLLFVFWYCHKRGKEVRLEKERDLTEQEVARLEEEYAATHPESKTTAACDAPIDEVKAGMDEVELAKQAAAAAEAATSPEKGPNTAQT